MAIRKPLVLNNGEMEQLQAGDSIAHPGLFERSNDNAAALVIGQPVYVSGDGAVDMAQADAASTKDVLGLCAEGIAIAGSGNIQSDNVLTASTGEWDALTGDVGGLVAGSWYYLDEATAGKLTATAPTTGYIAKVGQALSTTELEISIKPTIKL